MSNTGSTQENHPPDGVRASVPSDVDVSQYESEYQLNQQDVLPVAKFFNQVGGDLSSLQRHNVDGKQVLKLDKDKVIPPTFQESTRHRTTFPHAAVAHTQPHNPHPLLDTQHEPQPSMHPLPPSSGVTLKDLEHIQKIEKKLSTTNRKVTTIDKRIATLESIVNLPKKKLKYNVKTSDVDCTTSNTDILVTTICDQINSGATDISISRC